MRHSFVKGTLERLIRESVVSAHDSILVIAGGKAEKHLFQELNLDDVTISNLDERMTANEFLPFEWSFQDAQNLTFADESFDFAFVSDGLHHCRSPHLALIEMYRIARKSVIVFVRPGRCASALQMQGTCARSFLRAWRSEAGRRITEGRPIGSDASPRPDCDPETPRRASAADCPAAACTR